MARRIGLAPIRVDGERRDTTQLLFTKATSESRF
jgi:hypothetical protein